MIGGRKVRSNKGKRRGSYKTGKTRSGAKFRGRKVNVKSSVKKARKVRSNKGKRRTPYGKRTGITRSKRKFRGGSESPQEEAELTKLPQESPKEEAARKRKERKQTKKGTQYTQNPQIQYTYMPPYQKVRHETNAYKIAQSKREEAARQRAARNASQDITINNLLK